MDPGVIILLASFGLPLVAMGLILLWLRSQQRDNVRHARELAGKKRRAKEANARILNVRQGMIAGDIHRIVHVDLEVLPTSGDAFRTTATWFVDTLHFSQIQEGMVIPVKVDVENRAVVYPNVRWATYTEGYQNL